MEMSLTRRVIMMSIISLAEPELYYDTLITHTYTSISYYGGGIQERDQSDTVIKLLLSIYNYSISPLQHLNVLLSLSFNRLPRLLPLHPNHPAILVLKLPVFPSHRVTTRILPSRVRSRKSLLPPHDPLVAHPLTRMWPSAAPPSALSPSFSTTTQACSSTLLLAAPSCAFCCILWATFKVFVAVLARSCGSALVRCDSGCSDLSSLMLMLRNRAQLSWALRQWS